MADGDGAPQMCIRVADGGTAVGWWRQLVGLTGVDRRPLHLRPFYIYIHTHLPAQRRSTPLTHPSRNPQPATRTTTNKENMDQNCSLLAAVERERERKPEFLRRGGRAGAAVQMRH